MHEQADNVDPETVEGFGAEWARFAHEDDTPEMEELFGKYFSEFPWHELEPHAVGVDVGCGSGRWARRVAPRVGELHCVDASGAALEVCRRNLQGRANVRFHQASVGELPFEDASLDFAYSLGVLHHVPDTEAGLREIARVLKPGAPLLVYLYYSLDNRAWWYQQVWRASDVARQRIARMPTRARFVIADILAATIYWPLSRAARVVEKVSPSVAEQIPLSAYRDRSYYVLRTDALDRFGTQLEQRFSRAEIEAMLVRSGFEDVTFREGVPYWCAVAHRCE